jgi:hypothetical protein
MSKEGKSKLDYYISINNFNCYERFSINVTCWFGKEFAKFGGNVGVIEEAWLTHTYPAEHNRYSIICGTSLFSHYSFQVQKKGLDAIPQILDAYKKICLKKNGE